MSLKDCVVERWLLALTVLVLLLEESELKCGKNCDCVGFCFDSQLSSKTFVVVKRLFSAHFFRGCG